MPRSIQTLTLKDAREMIAAGESKALQLGIPYNLAVVDAGGGTVDQEQQVVEAALAAYSTLS